MKFIPKDITDRLENEWRQIVDPKSDSNSDAALSTRPTDHVRKMAAIAIAQEQQQMPTFHFNIRDGVDAEMDMECATACEAVSSALRAMSEFVSRKSVRPGDISIIVMDADRSEVAVIAVTFPKIQNKGPAH
jgi:hypothetical protein